MRSRGTFFLRKTFSRKGRTSSCFSGPPKETINSASNEFMGDLILNHGFEMKLANETGAAPLSAVPQVHRIKARFSALKGNVKPTTQVSRASDSVLLPLLENF